MKGIQKGSKFSPTPFLVTLFLWLFCFRKLVRRIHDLSRIKNTCLLSCNIESFRKGMEQFSGFCPHRRREKKRVLVKYCPQNASSWRDVGGQESQISLL
jgi:hypothetical protein